MIRRCLLVGCGLVTLLFGLAWASTGGPQEIRILGYERGTRALFFAAFDYSESGQEPQVFSISVDSLGRGAPHFLAPPVFPSVDQRFRVDWVQAKMDSLRGVLTKLDTLS